MIQPRPACRTTFISGPRRAQTGSTSATVPIMQVTGWRFSKAITTARHVRAMESTPRPNLSRLRREKCSRTRCRGTKVGYRTTWCALRRPLCGRLLLTRCYWLPVRTRSRHFVFVAQDERPPGLPFYLVLGIPVQSGVPRREVAVELDATAGNVGGGARRRQGNDENGSLAAPLHAGRVPTNAAERKLDCSGAEASSGGAAGRTSTASLRWTAPTATEHVHHTADRAMIAIDASHPYGRHLPAESLVDTHTTRLQGGDATQPQGRDATQPQGRDAAARCAERRPVPRRAESVRRVATPHAQAMSGDDSRGRIRA